MTMFKFRCRMTNRVYEVALYSIEDARYLAKLKFAELLA